MSLAPLLCFASALFCFILLCFAFTVAFFSSLFPFRAKPGLTRHGPLGRRISAHFGTVSGHMFGRFWDNLGFIFEHFGEVFGTVELKSENKLSDLFLGDS